MDKIYKIVELLHRCKSGKLSEADRLELDEWLDVDKNRQLAEKLLSEGYEEERMKAFIKYNPDQAYRHFAGESVHRRVIWRWLWAAAIVLPMVLAIGLLLKQPQGGKPDKAVVAKQMIPAGKSKALLTLSTGQTVVLGEEQPVYTREEEGVLVKADSTNLVYERKAELPVELVYNELTVPRKGEYSLQLSDGTKVYLNSDSWLKYPETFGKDRREVQLTGEAYFEVKRDSLRPFIVKVGNMQVNVLGTVFNINAYQEGTEIKTTLVSGKVNVACHGNSVELLPGEQACLHKPDHVLHKEKVNVALYTSWKEGLFKFERESLENIMLVLERWYDVNVFFQNNALRESLFSGDLKKYDSIEEHLRMLELTTNVSFRISGNTILVGYK